MSNLDKARRVFACAEDSCAGNPMSPCTFENEVCDVAEDYLRFLDPTPLTLDLFKAMGAVQCRSPISTSEQWKLHGVVEVQFDTRYRTYGECNGFVLDGEYYELTLGQLHSLCFALGLPVQTKEKT